MKSFGFIISILLLPVIAWSQVLQLSFSALNNGVYQNLDSIRIKNVNQWNDTLLIWPDTTLLLAYVGIDNVINEAENQFDARLLDDYGNTDGHRALVRLTTSGTLQLTVHDLTGRVLQSRVFVLNPGNHLFTVKTLTNDIVILKALFKNQERSLKMISIPSTNNYNSIEYSGMIGQNGNRSLSTESFSFNYGDYLLLTGWVDGVSSVITCQPLSDSNFIFTYGMNYPCPGIPSFTYGGQIYHTVQIGDQCWMKENLNIGNMVVSTETIDNFHSDCSDNGIIEKYCYNNDSAMCTEYGGLYDWDEMMNYTVGSGVQGICPQGWHIPSDQDWCTLTSYVDPLLNCNAWYMTGYTAGNFLKEPGLIHWNWPESGATNASGFTGLGAGARHGWGGFLNLKNSGVFWTSSDYSTQFGIDWELLNGNPNISHGYIYKPYGFSIRCLKD